MERRRKKMAEDKMNWKQLRADERRKERDVLLCGGTEKPPRPPVQSHFVVQSRAALLSPTLAVGEQREPLV